MGRPWRRDPPRPTASSTGSSACSSVYYVGTARPARCGAWALLSVCACERGGGGESKRVVAWVRACERVPLALFWWPYRCVSCVHVCVSVVRGLGFVGRRA